MKPGPRLEQLLASPRLPAIAAAFGAALSAPAIGTGFQLDDLLHSAALRGLEPYATWVSSPWKLFTFFDGVPSHDAFLRAQGVLAWWSDPALKIAFFRPVSIVTHLVDHRLFPDAPWAMHLHSIAWYAALVALVALFYRRLIATRWVAGLAAMLYAIDDAHAVPASWIANRNATVCATFAVSMLLLHDRAVRDRSRVSAVLAPLALAASLGAGETGVGALAWLASYTLVLDEDGWKRRLARLLPYAAVFAAWAIAWRASGAGSHGSALYSDPLSHPLRFLADAPARALLLVLGAFTNTPVDVAPFAPALLAAMLGLAILVSIAAVVALAPLVRGRKTARFFALGAVLSLVPATAVVPSNRVLVLASVGLFGLVAELVEVASQGLARSFAWFSLVVHVGVSPLAFVVGTQQFAITGRFGAKFAREIPTDASIEGRDVVALDASEPALLPYASIERRLAGKHAPRRVWVLSIAWAPVEVARVDDRTLRLKPAQGFVADPMSGLMRDPRDPIPVGVPIACGPMTAIVLSTTPDGRPAEAIFRFDRALDDPSLSFVRFDGDAFRPAALPKQGETITLPAVPLF